MINDLTFQYYLRRYTSDRVIALRYPDSYWFRFTVAPIVTLRMGTSLDPKGIKEGNDVYFECNVRANPAASKLTWFHEVNIIL